MPDFAAVPFKMADTVVLDQASGRFTIDGQDFPWAVSDRITVEAGYRDIATVTVHIFCESVQILPRGGAPGHVAA